MKYALEDMDNPIWILISGLFVMLATAISLCCFYNKWETPKDLLTISTVTTAYFVSALGKRLIRTKQRDKRDGDLEPVTPDK